MNHKEYKSLLAELNEFNKDEKEILLAKLRNEMDSLDENLAKILNKRTYISVIIGRVKRALKMPTYSPEREREISKKINKFAKKPLTISALQRIYERILDESRAIQKNDIEENEIKYGKDK